ncbi:hypothetical protein KCU77_g2563, partial [Aureobasidium melanogenum]
MSLNLSRLAFLALALALALISTATAFPLSSFSTSRTPPTIATMTIPFVITIPASALTQINATVSTTAAPTISPPPVASS